MSSKSSEQRGLCCSYRSEELNNHNNTSSSSGGGGGSSSSSGGGNVLAVPCGSGGTSLTGWGFRGNVAQLMDPQVTFFWLDFAYGKRGRARGLSGAVGGPAGVLSGVLGECVDYDERGGVCGLFKVKDHVFGGLDGPLVMKPADLWFGHAGHACMEAGHLPVCYRAAPDRLDEGGLLANGGFLCTGETGGDVPLRHSCTGLGERLS